MKPNLNHRPAAAQPRRSSPGARRVLKWLIQGHDLAAIARRLGRNEQNLKQRLAAMMARLGVDTPQAALDKLRAQHQQHQQHQGQGQGQGQEQGPDVVATEDSAAAPPDEFADIDVGDDDEQAASQAAVGSTTE